MSEDELEEFREKMTKTQTALQNDLNKIRTGRASLAILDEIRVEYYGSPTPLNQVATMAVPESRLITIKPWDTNIIGEIEKAILKSELGVTPVNDGKIIRIPIPALTEERRRELVKVIKKMGEKIKVSLRSIRREINEKLKSMKKEKEISEDQYYTFHDEVQEITDEFIKKADTVLAEKEKQLLEL